MRKFFNSKQRFGIRKIHGITGSVLLGLLVMSMATVSNVSANEVSEASSVVSRTTDTNTTETSTVVSGITDTHTADTSTKPIKTENESVTAVDTESETAKKTKIKHYNPKWDTIDESGNVVRDLNKYSDTEANKVAGSNTEEQPEIKPTEIKPVDKESFNFKTVWDDDSTETKQGTGSNMPNNSLLFTYSNTEPAQNLYVTVSKTDTHKIVKSSQSEYLGDLTDGRSVYKIAYLNGASQIEFKSQSTNELPNTIKRKNGQTIDFEYKVYQNTSQDKNLDINSLISTATELYTGKVSYTYDHLKQAGYTVTDKLTSVVESNVKPDNDFRTIMVSEHDSKTDEVITKLTKISMITGLNNAAYSKSYTYGDSAYEITSEYEIPNHENETITVLGLPDGLTPTVKHERLANGSYKINMRDLMREPNGTTTLDLNVSDEFSNQLITGGIIVKPEYKLERLNDNGTQFIQIVKDPYGFNLYSKDISVGTEFAHSTVIPKNQFLSIDNKNKYGEYVSVADDKHSHIPLVDEYSYKGDGVGRATVVYDLTGIDSHFNKVLNTDATVYAYVNNTWVEVSKGDGNRDVELPSNTKKVALSHDNLVKDEAKSPKFDVSLDDVATFKSENKNTRKILDMHARIFNIPDAVTFMDEETINNTSTVLAERVLMLPEENWSYIVSIIKDRYDLPFETGTTTIETTLTWATNGPSNTDTDHPNEKIDYFVHITNDLKPFKLKFSDNVTILSETQVDNGVVYRISPVNNDINKLNITIDSDGITPVNGKITVGKISKSDGQSPFTTTNTLITEHGSTYKVAGSNTSIDFGRDLKDNYITADTSDVVFNPLRESFSKLELVERDSNIDANTKDIVYNYDLIGKVNDHTGNGKSIKSATFGIPKTENGTILNLAKSLDNISGVSSYSYELNNSGTFVDTVDKSDLSKVTKVKVTYDNAVKVTPEKPWVLTVPLVLDEDSKSTKTATGTLTFDYSDDTTLITNTVDLKKEYVPLKEKDVINFTYMSSSLLQDNNSTIDHNFLYVPDRITTLKKYIQENGISPKIDSKYESRFESDLFSRSKATHDGFIIDKIKTGTTGLVTLNTDELFEYVYQNLAGESTSKKGVIVSERKSDPYGSDTYLRDNTKDILQAIVKVDKNGNYSLLKKGEVLNVSDIQEIRVYYSSFTKPKVRGYVYTPSVDSLDPTVRTENGGLHYNMMALADPEMSEKYMSPLYEDDIEGLEPGSSVVVNHKEIPSKTVVEENEKFKRTLTYSYTYHKLNDMDGFKDNGTRVAALTGSDMHAVFFYDEHVDEKIEWKTKPLTVNYIDSETNETLTSYNVQRLKDEPIGEFDKEYPNYTFERSDFNSTDLMGDSERTINMYFKHQKATVRTEVYVDNTLVSTTDKEVNTLSKVDKGISDLTLEHDNKVAKYVRTESDNDTVGEEGSVTTVKHYYETVSEINGVAVNVVFKDGNTVVGSTLAESTKSDNEISWSVISNVSDTIDTNTYKPVNGDWATTELKGTLSYDSNKKVYTVEVPVTKRVGRIVVKYVDESGSEIRTPEVYKDQPIGTEYDKVSPTTNIPVETGYVNKDGKLYMRTTGYVRVTKDNFGPGTISEGDNVFTFIYKKVTKDIEATVTGKVPNDAPIIDKDVKELTPDLHGTVYEADPTKPKGETEVVVEGSDGYTITSTSYTHDENGNIVTTPNEPEVVKPVARVVKVGIKPKVEETPIGYYTRYERDDELTAGEQITSVHGKEGKTTTTTTYTMNPDTGVVTENPSVTVEEKSVNEVIKVGTKPKVVTEQLTKEIRYTSDPSKDKGEKTVITEGENGKVVTTIPYILNDVEGTVSEGKSEIVRHEGKPKIISVGTKPKVEVAKIPVTIRYEYNPNMDKDYRKVITEGSEGKLTTTTTYTVNEQTGDLSESKSTVETVKMIERVIEIGTKEIYVPNEAPVHEKPEYEGGAVPNEAPVHTLPEYEGGVVPNEAPVHTLPEYEGGVVPNEAPVHTLPEYEGGVVPNDAPVHTLPEYEGGVVPNDAPVHKLPEYEGGVVPNDAPVHTLPEYEGGVVPNDAPVHTLPEYEGGVVPNDAPVHTLPEYEGGVTPNEAPVHTLPEYEGGVVPNDAPVHTLPEYEGCVVPNDAPVHTLPEFNGGVTPNDAPIHDKPEFDGGVTPNEAPIHDKPEFNGGVTPNEAPIHDKPEFNGGVTPNDAPIHDKPEFNGGVTPNEAPIHDKPEFNRGVTPNDAPIHDKPEFNGGVTPNEAPIHDKPEFNGPTTTQTSNPNQLPNTGEKQSSVLGILGSLGIISALLSVLHKRKKFND